MYDNFLDMIFTEGKKVAAKNVKKSAKAVVKKIVPPARKPVAFAKGKPVAKALPKKSIKKETDEEFGGRVLGLDGGLATTTGPEQNSQAISDPNSSLAGTPNYNEDDTDAVIPEEVPEGSEEETTEVEVDLDADTDASEDEMEEMDGSDELTDDTAPADDSDVETNGADPTFDVEDGDKKIPTMNETGGENIGDGSNDSDSDAQKDSAMSPTPGEDMYQPSGDDMSSNGERNKQLVGAVDNSDLAKIEESFNFDRF